MTRIQIVQLVLVIILVGWFLACSAGCWFWYRLRTPDRKRGELEELLAGMRDHEPVYPRWCSTCLREGRQTRVGWTAREDQWGICPRCAQAIRERLRAKAAHERRMAQS